MSDINLIGRVPTEFLPDTSCVTPGKRPRFGTATVCGARVYNLADGEGLSRRRARPCPGSDAPPGKRGVPRLGKRCRGDKIDCVASKTGYISKTPEAPKMETGLAEAGAPPTSFERVFGRRRTSRLKRATSFFVGNHT